MPVTQDWPRTEPESAAAIRAYLQRCEVRLSTVHRVASALLSGAGLIVLFPALAKDSIARIVRALLDGPADAPHRLVLVAVVALAALPIAALWLLLRDLVRFYFAGQHFDTEQSKAFFPRFALSGLRVSPTDVTEDVWNEIDLAHHDPNVRAFLLPENRYSRDRIDDQMARYRLNATAEGVASLTQEQRDEARRLALLELAATGTRSLPQQAARMEQVLARHILNLQALVLRYAKAVLAMLTTAIAAFALSSVIDHDPDVTTSSVLWLAGIIAVWAPAIIVAVTAPLAWILEVGKSEGASDRAARSDPQFSQLEDTTVRIAAVAWIAATAATVIGASRSPSAPVEALVIGALSAAGLVIALVRWDGRRAISRMLRWPIATG